MVGKGNSGCGLACVFLPLCILGLIAMGGGIVVIIGVIISAIGLLVSKISKGNNAGNPKQVKPQGEIKEMNDRPPLIESTAPPVPTKSDYGNYSLSTRPIPSDLETEILSVERFEHWLDVLQVLKEKNKPLYGTLTDSIAYVDGDMLRVDAGSSDMFAKMMRGNPRAKEELRDAVFAVTGKRYRLGPYISQSTATGLYGNAHEYSMQSEHIPLFGRKEQIQKLQIEIEKFRSLFEQEKSKNVALSEKIAELEEQLTPEHRQIEWLNQEISALTEEKKMLFNENELIREDSKSLSDEIELKKSQIIELDDEILYQDYALYKPIYSFATSEIYKGKLTEIRAKQKAMIKAKNAATCSTNWTVNNSKREGDKMTNSNIKQIVRTFNTDCENAIDRVKFSNFDSMKARIQKSYDSLNLLNAVNKISINNSYLQLKFDELRLAIEYAMKKQDEKEEERIEREILREQRKVQKEIEERRKFLIKEQQHYQNFLDTIENRLKTADENATKDLMSKKSDTMEKLDEISESMKQIDYREANQRAGYVYIISNIGAFGKNVYKIGMTRRLEPAERIKELSGASVPYPFDIHALIFSDDAPKLEAALHRAFDEQKINAVNTRKEFFNVSLEDIKRVVNENFDKTVDFVDMPEAEHYRQSVRIHALAVGEYQNKYSIDDENNDDNDNDDDEAE